MSQKNNHIVAINEFFNCFISRTSMIEITACNCNNIETSLVSNENSIIFAG